jgi:hypothetical protein
MFNTLVRLVSVLLLAAIGHASNAEDGTNRYNATLVSGGYGEVMEIGLLLVDRNGEERSQPCEASFSVKGRDATRRTQYLVLDKDVTLSPEANFDVVSFVFDSVTTIILTIADMQTQPDCSVVASQLRIAGPADANGNHETRSAEKQSLYFPETMLVEIQEEANGAAHRAPGLFSGSSDEALVLRFTLDPMVYQDGRFRNMLAEACHTTFTLVWRNAMNYSGGIVAEQTIDLAAGGFAEFIFPFGDIGGDPGYLALSVADASIVGRCRLLASARSATAEGETRAVFGSFQPFMQGKLKVE